MAVVRVELKVVLLECSKVVWTAALLVNSKVVWKVGQRDALTAYSTVDLRVDEKVV